MTRTLSSLALLLAIALGIGLAFGEGPTTVPKQSEARLVLEPLVAVFNEEAVLGARDCSVRTLEGRRGCVSGHERDRLGYRDVVPRSVAVLARQSPLTQPRRFAHADIVAAGSLGTALLGGWISWADPDLGGDYLATRFPRGTLVRLCTPNRCIVRRSNDWGPSAAIDPPRIADLAVLDWESLCGLPRSRGVCRGTVEAITDLPLPPTDTVK